MGKTESLYAPTREDLLKYESDERGSGLSQNCLLRESLMPYRQSVNTKEWVRWFELMKQEKPNLTFETKGLTIYNSYFPGRSKTKIYHKNGDGVDGWKKSLLKRSQRLWQKYKKNYSNIHPESISFLEDFRKINHKKGLNFLILKLELEKNVWQTFLREIAKHTGTLVQREEVIDSAEKYFRIYRTEGGSVEIGTDYEPTKLYPIDFGKEFEEFYLGLLG